VTNALAYSAKVTTTTKKKFDDVGCRSLKGFFTLTESNSGILDSLFKKVTKSVSPWNTKGGSITVLLTSCLTGLESAV
jgi:hypothetical protein